MPLFHEYPLLPVAEHSVQHYDGLDALRIDSQKYGTWCTDVRHDDISSAMSVCEQLASTVTLSAIALLLQQY